MTESVTPDNVGIFLSRFWKFYDGVIRRVSLDLPPNALGQATLDVLVRDANRNADWVICTIVVEELGEFILTEGKTSHLALSDGLKVIWANDLMFIDFAGVAEKPSAAEIRASGFYVAGRRVSWSVRDLRDSDAST